MLLSTPLGVIIENPSPVVVQAYTESLCIDCKNFFVNSLIPVYNVLGPDIIDLDIIPSGNAELDIENKTVKCQHGPAECDANVWEQCSVRQTDPPTYLKFFECLEHTLPMGQRNQPFEEDVFAKCATQSDIEFEGLKRCHDNPVLRWMLQKENSEKTPADHQYVPWVLINGKKFNYEHDDFLTIVCQEYTENGGSHPACPSGIEKAGVPLR